MIECAIPQDILKYKNKFIGNFSAREAGFLVVGACAAVVSYMSLFDGIEGKTRIYLSAIIAVPFLLMGFFRPLDQPLEKVLVQVVYDNFICPPKRKYEIRRPGYEKYLKTGELPKDAEEADEEENAGKKGKKQGSKKAKEIKIEKSKEYKSIK